MPAGGLQGLWSKIGFLRRVAGLLIQVGELPGGRAPAFVPMRQLIGDGAMVPASRFAPKAQQGKMFKRSHELRAAGNLRRQYRPRTKLPTGVGSDEPSPRYILPAQEH